jgi:pimeloyl-ACP methyl ester carboxylesterase
MFARLSALTGLLALYPAVTPAAALPITNPTQAAAATIGPGATNRLGCRVPYGDPPRPLAPASPNGTFKLRSSCLLLGGQRLNWVDANLTPRHACLITPPQASASKPLPLLVWLSPSLAPVDAIRQTNVYSQRLTANLTGDLTRLGYILLLPAPREIQHIYPWPNQRGYGWDNWYRNLDRTSGSLNVDAAAIDYFIDQAKAKGNVDAKRVYMSGWSDGAAFSLLYALNTPGIAAAAVYSAPAPFSDINDPCWQTPFATQATPVYDLHNACDVYGICQTGTQFHAQLQSLYPQFDQTSDILRRGTGRLVNACDSACAPGSPLSYNLGLLEHRVWPYSQTSDMFTFLRQHPLGTPKR